MILVARIRRRGDGARQPDRTRASRRRSRGARRGGRSPRARCSSDRTPRRRRATTRPDRTTCCRPSGAARFRGGLSAADFVRVMAVQRLTRDGLERSGADDHLPLARAEGLRRARRIDRSPTGCGLAQRHMTATTTTSRPSCTTASGSIRTRTPAAARRGCSKRWRRSAPDQIAFYPPYKAVVDACARYFGVAPDRVALTNGLDEGILAAAVAYLRRSRREPAEAIVPEPAFEIFALDASVVGGRPVAVAADDPTSRSRSTKCSPRSRQPHGSCFSPTRTTRPASRCRWRRSRRSPRACRRARSSSSTRPTPISRARRSFPSCRILRT